jgi:hypothetical protein
MLLLSSHLREFEAHTNKELMLFQFCWKTEKLKRVIKFGCADSDGEIPDPIPNSEVKPVSGDGTALSSVGE